MKKTTCNVITNFVNTIWNIAECSAVAYWAFMSIKKIFALITSNATIADLDEMILNFASNTIGLIIVLVATYFITEYFNNFVESLEETED